MKFRTGLLIGAALGYYYGAKAGRERYEQIDAWLAKLRRTAAYQDAESEAKEHWNRVVTAARKPFGTAADSLAV